jgi:hypothetical protein
MARYSKKQDMQGLSAFLGFAFLCLATFAVVAFKNRSFTTALDLIGWSFMPLAVTLAFTWPTRCRVTTSRGKPCKGNAYGFLFGCNAYNHFWTKFFVRLGLQKDAQRTVERHQSTGGDAMANRPASDGRPIAVTITENRRDICGFWIGVISAAAGVIQVITSFIAH